MKRILRLIHTTLFLAIGTGVQAGDWSSRTLTGDQVRVDPSTNRATVTVEGVTTQLWDGTHQLQDGSTLIIRKGIAVPTKSIIDSREPQLPAPEEWEGLQIVGYSPCEKLARSMCGKDGQCKSLETCDLAQQLLVMEGEERRGSNNPNLMTYTSGQCLNASKEREFFIPCDRQTIDEQTQAD